MQSSYLDFDELLDTIHDKKVLMALGRLAHQDFITSAQPAAIVVPYESLGVGLFIIEVTEDNGWRLDKELAALLVLCNFVALEVNDFSCRTGKKTARGPKEGVGFACTDDGG